MRNEELCGSLEVGKRGDFVLIDRNLLECPPDEIADTNVLATWIDGQIVYQSQDELEKLGDF